MSPQRPDLVLAPDVPDIEFGVLVRHGLDVEADGWDGGDVLVELELVQNGWREGKGASISDCSFFDNHTGMVGIHVDGKHTGLAGSVEPQHQQSHFLRSEDLVHHFGYLTAHGVWVCSDGIGGIWRGTSPGGGGNLGWYKAESGGDTERRGQAVVGGELRYGREGRLEEGARSFSKRSVWWVGGLRKGRSMYKALKSSRLSATPVFESCAETDRKRNWRGCRARCWG